MTLPTAQEIASLYLYGSATPPVKFDDPTLIRPDGEVASKSVAKVDYFDPITGPGRFALGSEFSIVDDFFTTKDYWIAQMNAPLGGVFSEFFQAGDTELRLTKQQFAENILGFDPASDFYGLNVANRSVSDGYDDYAERMFIWGGTQFKLGDATEFVFRLDGQFAIENYSIEPLRPDNFDFDGSDIITNLGNNLLEHAMDPSGIGRRVDLNFSPEMRPTSTYTSDDFQADQATAAGWIDPGNSATVSAINTITSELFDAGITSTIIDGKPVIYGSEGDDFVVMGTGIVDHYDISDPFGSTVFFGEIDYYFSEYVNNGIIYLTGAGEDDIQGTIYDDKFLTGGDMDTILGHLGNDWIDGGAGADVIDGGDGIDVLHFDKTGAGVTVDLKDGTGLGGDAEGDTYSNIEVVIGTDNVDTFNSQLGSGHRFAGGVGNDVFDFFAI